VSSRSADDSCSETVFSAFLDHSIDSVGDFLGFPCRLNARDSAAANEGLLIFTCGRFFHPRLVQIRHKSENPLSGTMTLARIAEFLPYRFRSIAVAFEYGRSCGETSKVPRNTLNEV
jgi:hypothetical protein